MGYDAATWETDESDIADFQTEIDKYLANRWVGVQAARWFHWQGSDVLLCYAALLWLDAAARLFASSSTSLTCACVRVCISLVLLVHTPQAE